MLPCLRVFSFWKGQSSQWLAQDSNSMREDVIARKNVGHSGQLGRGGWFCPAMPDSAPSRVCFLRPDERHAWQEVGRGRGDREMVGVPHTSVYLSSVSFWAPSREGASETWVVGASQQDGFPVILTEPPLLCQGPELSHRGC